MATDLMRVIDVPADEVRQLRNDNHHLREELSAVKKALADARRESVQMTTAVQALQKQLAPLHRALQAVFGEIHAVVGDASTDGAATGSTQDPRVAAVWSQWKT